MKTIKYTISALCLFLVSLAYGQTLPICTDFNTGSFDGWETNGVSASISSPAFDSSNYLRLKDESNDSRAYNSTSYPNNWEEFIGDCLCFDYKVYNDGWTDDISNIHPRIEIYNGSTPLSTDNTITASFIATITVTENDEWVHICAPIEFSDQNGLPANADGAWANVTPGEWNTLLSHVGGITFRTDIANSPWQTEVVGVDNICIQNCNIVPPVNPNGAYCCDSINLVTNGNFEDLFNLGFTSTYTNNSTTYPGEYDVTNSATAFGANVTDHSFCLDPNLYPSNNHFMVVNGKTQQSGDAIIWEQTISGLDTNSNYIFCANFKNMPQCTFDILPIVSFSIEPVGGLGVQTLPSTISAVGTDPCDWILQSFNFNTGASTSVILSIILDQSGNGDGNDLAIDDISVSKLFDPELSITVQHQGSPDQIKASVNTIDTNDDILPCADSSFQWSVAEVLSYTPGVPIPGIFNFDPSWTLTTTFPGFAFDPTKMYMIVLHTPACDCYDEGYTFQLTYNFRPMAIQFTPEQELSIIESIRNGTISNGETINATEELNDGSDDLILYPNPVENSFTISLKDNSLKSVEVLSLTGQTLFSKKYSDAKAEEILDISQLASGIYLVKVYGMDNTQYTTKVVKQ